MSERSPEQEAIANLQDARRFNDFMSKNRFRKEEYRRLAQMAVASGLPEEGRALDIGTGSGLVAIELARLLRGKSWAVVGLDLSNAMLAVAAENAAAAGLEDAIVWQQGDANAMPFGDSEFDLVISNDSLHHWQDPLPVMNEIARVLKHSGRAVVHDSRRLGQWPARLLAWLIGRTIPADFRVHYWNSIHSSYTPEELKQILSRSRLSGWRIEEQMMELTVMAVGRSG